MTQLEATKQVTSDGQPRTLKRIAAEVGQLLSTSPSEASISARLRDLRKDGLEVVKEADGEGGFLYSVRRSAAAEPAVNTPVAGSRSAIAFANSLK